METSPLIQHLTNLRIISHLEVGQKLDTKNNRLDIYTMSWYWPTWLYRKFVQDNKVECVEYLRNLYKDIEQDAARIIDSYKSANDPCGQLKYYKLLLKFAEKLASSIRGLNNLKETYKGFQRTQADIESLKEDNAIIIIENILNQIINVEKIKFKNRLTKQPVVTLINNLGNNSIDDDGPSDSSSDVSDNEIKVKSNISVQKSTDTTDSDLSDDEDTSKKAGDDTSQKVNDAKKKVKRGLNKYTLLVSQTLYNIAKEYNINCIAHLKSTNKEYV